MACPPIITGDEFLLRTLTHLDCQAQVIGSYGYQTLGQPGSVASILVAGLLTLFIAFFGIRLLFGPPPGPRDLVYDALKIGIVLTLAFSWPAFRTVVYDVTLEGPAEIAGIVSASSGNSDTGSLFDRLQDADNDMVRLTEIGMGRNNAALLSGDNPGDSFQGAALEDEAAIGAARLLYLAGVVGPLALLRIAAGLLLAITPLVAALFFFSQSRGIFAGWLKGLVLTFAGSIGTAMVLSVQLSMIEPWLADALRVRGLGYATPSAPTELFAITLAFAIANLAMIWLLAKIVFHRGWLTLPDYPRPQSTPDGALQNHTQSARTVEQRTLRAEQISATVESSVRRERITTNRLLTRESSPQASAETTNRLSASSQPRLGSSYRRPSIKQSSAAKRRDNAQ